ncbi:DNA repair protein RecN [Wenyingzhuangia sp. 2_MG-2023]|uniref:DNA repair protein RecN n=1 Tax=Wenyingzhuangia sp. 2_MG-2023 TaxID=3062639 RepID=UPI0026E45EFE|nr:DNA repair protein RecN [Wenyingzhuangia sp. 2_MG-2023]MDO6736946.1 DNA repair protein RecN [Wenyingzhuangia sp. 2_MG-2023]
MLVSLTVQNYALIKRLQVDFSEGYSVITGETGAGKSILLGALGLVLGNRADLTHLKDKTEKCVIEAEFQIQAYQLESIFEDLELDYEANTIVRRELLPSGKTRAFINDTPVNLKSLQALKEYLLDIHSQHNTMALSDKNYQYYIVDALAGNLDLLKTYKSALKNYKAVVKKLENLKISQEEAQQQYEYNLHLYQELQSAKLKELDEIETLEAEIEKLSHAEEIKINLFDSLQVASEEEIGVQSLLGRFQLSLSKIAPYDASYASLSERAKSLKIELDDLVFELEKQAEKVDIDPDELERMNQRLTLLFDLQKKHFVSSIEDLIVVRETLAVKVGQVEDAADLLVAAEKQVDLSKKQISEFAKKLSSNRKKIVNQLQVELEQILAVLGMENAQFKVDITTAKEFTDYGVDDVSFLLSSNKGSDFGLLKKVASGGELSRIMLGIKMILSKFVHLPTILFDEIDTGVSGDIATKIADLMQAMGKNMQVITITHLPQVAAKGHIHYKVYKEVEGEETVTHLTQLSTEERVHEIAEMLGGKEKTQSALEHAQQLLSI